MRIVAFAGPKTCGKDTAASALFNQEAVSTEYVFRNAKLAEGVKNICAEMFGYTTAQMEDSVLKETKTDTYPYIEPRWPMMDIANWLRDKYGADVHCQRWERIARISEERALDLRMGLCHVVTDLRFPEELTMFKRLNAFIIYVEREEAEQALASKQSAGDAMALNPSEAHYAAIKDAANVVLHNNGTIAQLQAEVLNLVKLQFGHWQYWAQKDQEEAQNGKG